MFKFIIKITLPLSKKGTHANLKRCFTEEQQKSLLCEFTCGFLVGATQSIIASPMELLKSRLQAKSLQPNNEQKINLIRDIKNLRKDYPKQNIVRSLYRGYGATFWRDSPAFAIYFSSYELTLRYMNPNGKKEEPSNFVILGAGGIAGVLSWFLTYPIDVVKTQIQLNPHLTVRNYLRSTYQQVGLKGLSRCLSRGLLIACIRAAYCNAVTFYFYHLTVKFMINKNL